MYAERSKEVRLILRQKINLPPDFIVGDLIHDHTSTVVGCTEIYAKYLLHLLATWPIGDRYLL
jgi:hypothetical protein